MLSDSPLRRREYLLFFLGTAGTAVGYTMQGTLSAWLMTTLTSSALMVTLVQTATSTPILLLGLLAGALADSMDRRTLILVTQIVMLAGIILMGIATSSGTITPIALLVLTGCISSGFAFYAPAQLASLDNLVKRHELAQALALNAISFNVARSVGPAVAGILASNLSTGVALIGSAFFFIFMMWATIYWKNTQTLPERCEPLYKGIASGVRYAWQSKPMCALVVCNVSFSFCASAFWGLLAVIARDQLKLEAGGFGLLFAGFGIGAVSCATLIPTLIQKYAVMTIVKLGFSLWSGAILLLAFATTQNMALTATLLAGCAWVLVLACLSTSTQSHAPSWIKARAVSIYMVATQAGLAAGSLFWGLVATVLSLRTVLCISVLLLLVLHLLTRNYRFTLNPPT